MRNEKGMLMTPMARRPLRQSLRLRLVGRRSRMISATLALVLAASMGASSPVAFADDLEDQQAALRDEAARVQHSLEFVDSRIAQAAADLVLYQGQLPAAQQALLDAQGRVAGAVQEVRPSRPAWTWRSRTRRKSPSSLRRTSRRSRTPGS